MNTNITVDVKSEITDIVNYDGKTLFNLSVDNKAIEYSTEVKCNKDIINALRRSITIISAFPEYKNELQLLNNLAEKIA